MTAAPHVSARPALQGTATQQRRDQAQAAAGLRVAGKSVWQIADTLSINADDVPALVAEGLATYTAEDPEARQAMRNLGAARLEHLLQSIWDMANDAEDPQFIEASSRAQSIIAELNRLLGLNAPQEHKVHSPELAQIGDLVRQITGLNTIEADPLDESTYSTDNTYHDTDIVEAQIVQPQIAQRQLSEADLL